MCDINAAVNTSLDVSCDAESQCQRFMGIDVSQLTPLTPEIIRKQATINFGTIGHVAHGKSTVVRAISGVQTVLKSLTLSYANAKIYKCTNNQCPPPSCYASYGSNKEDEPMCQVPNCGHPMRLVRHVSFVDCPGHDILMATMLSGAAVMDAALLLVAGNEVCPQPQTSEHLAAIEIMRLNHIIILQNKVELIKSSQAIEQHQQIQDFIAGTAAQNAPIIPISAVMKYNIDVLCEYICTQIPVPIRDFTSPPQMIIIRSFDVNKPGDAAETIRGGVAGGSILCGVLCVGKEIEIRPGLVDRENGLQVRPIRSRITSLFAEQQDLEFAVPGGLIGVGTTIDPALTRSDRLVGQILGYTGALPDIFIELELQYYLLRRLLGVKSKEGDKGTKVAKLKKGEYVMVNIGSTSVGCRIVQVKPEKAKFELLRPVCTRLGDKVALSRRVEKHWRLIGWAEILKGKTIEPSYDTGKE